MTDRLPVIIRAGRALREAERAAETVAAILNAYRIGALVVKDSKP